MTTSDSHTENTNVYESDLERLRLSTGLCEKTTGLESSAPLMCGHFTYHSFQNGLTAHSVNAIEQQTIKSATELPPGLSFNLIFSGVVQFEFAQNKYVMRANNNEVSCSAIINPSFEVMKRQMKKGMHVEKLNIFVELSWLEARCHSKAEANKLSRLFADKRVHTWVPSTKIKKKARQLRTLKKSDRFSEALHAEQLTMEVLTLCWSDLNKLTESESENPFTSQSERSINLKTLINEQFKSHHSICEIASALGMSERTLQRKFQKQYGSCISSYLQQRKMEQAKAALLIDHKTIGEAAFIAGYKHVSNFTKAFKNNTGMTPSKFVHVNK